MSHTYVFKSINIIKFSSFSGETVRFHRISSSRKRGMINTPNMLHRRIIEKSGELRTKLYGTEHVTLFSWKYVKDFFISIINLSWITIYMTFFSIIFGSWFVFAVIWCFIFWLHGDFGDDEDPLYEQNNRKCATNILGFTSCFLFSGNRFYIQISKYFILSSYIFYESSRV